ncbi:MAG TPA: NAD-dependent deacylase [Gemmatimonadales bacterium]|nr:NAD-dependent deacylase [Gemmatimonadales bacterium]
MSNPSLTRALDALAGAERMVVTTGAGMSRESGIPTFREALTGFWARYSPEEYATEAAFRRDPARVFGWYAWRRRLARRAVPHPGYLALVELEQVVPELVVVTQNVDGLHRRAGSRRVLELHGSLDRFCCADARHPAGEDEVPLLDADGPCPPPACRVCGSPLRPDVVWFGEFLPERVLTEAWERAAACQVMLVVGTSGLVHPAARLPYIARDAGATVIEINPEPTELTPLAHIVWRAAAGEALPRLLAGLSRTRRGADGALRPGEARS